MFSEIPPSWVTCSLGDLAEYIQRGKSPKYAEKSLLPVVNQKSIRWDRLIDDYFKYVAEEQQSLWEKDRYINVDDILWNSTGTGTVGRAYIVREWDTVCPKVVDSHVTIVRLHHAVSSKYAYFWIGGPYVQQRIEEMCDGSTNQIELSRSAISETQIPLAPVPEQHRIVAKIEELFCELDKGVEALKTVQQQLKVYRQAVLQQAFEGKLTEEWRKQQMALPTASQLLEQVRTAWEKQVKETGKKLKTPTPLTEAELPPLPEGWCWVRLGEIAYSVKDGPHYSPPYENNGIPFISGGNIRPEGVDFKSAKYISPELNEEFNKRCKPEPGDVLYTKGGTTGIARVNTYDFEFNVWVHVAVLKIVSSLTPFYVQHVLNSHHCYKQSQLYTHGVGNQDLGLTRMVNITLPICSLEEQKQVILEIESRLSVANKIEESISQSLKQAEALRQSILKRAFSGKLVPQDPNDEPAEKLLARIKAERAAQVPVKVAIKRKGTGRKKVQASSAGGEVVNLNSPKAW